MRYPNVFSISEHGDYLSIAEKIKKSSNANAFIFTNGCFDILHPGHLKTLEYCANLRKWDKLVVVGLNSDKSVSRLKGPSRPVMDQNARAAVLSALHYVDYVIIFDEDTPLQLIQALKPHDIVKGGDYKPEDVVGYDSAKIHIVEFEKGYSTTSILEKI